MVIRVNERATCRRCGARNVAWVTSKKGTQYLALCYMKDEVLVAETHRFHKCNGKPKAAKELPAVVASLGGLFEDIESRVPV